MTSFKDPITEGQAARAQYSAAHPNATEAELTCHFDMAYFQAELHNKNTSQKSATWQILKRDSQNECRGEDALLQFTDIAQPWRVNKNSLGSVIRTLVSIL
jgi:hypothetical protein